MATQNPTSSSDPRPVCQAVAFDLDGLMFNTEEIYFEVGDVQLQRRGQRFTPELRDKMMGRPGNDALQIMIDHHGLSATVAQLQLETEEIFAGLLAARLAPMPGLVDLLAELEAAGIPKGIATSSRPAFTEQIFVAYDWKHRFQFVLTSQDVTQGKPHPEIYLLAAKNLGVEPARLLVLEDSENGCRAAVAAGAVVVAVPGDHSRQHNFSGAALIADSLADPRIRGLLGI